MAEINTGLGWAAQDDWLVQGAGATIATLKKFGGSQFPGQPLAHAETAQDVINNGLCAVIADNWKYYFASAYGYNTLIFSVPSENKVYFVSETPGTVLLLEEIKPNGGLYPTTPITFSNSAIDPLYGFAWSRVTISGRTFVWQSEVPQFATKEDGFAAIEIVTIPFTKTNAGYSVYCTAKWKTSAGAVINTPILISSNSEFTDMEETSGTYNLAKLNILRQGMRFYMSFFDIADGSELTPSGNVLDLSGPDEPPRTLEQVFDIIADQDHAAIRVITAPDPYEDQSGASAEDGGDGDEIQNDDIDFTPAPTSMAVASGFITLFCPSQAELNALADYMWSPLFDVDTLKKLFANPMDCILGLSVIPVPIVPEGTKTVKVGGVSTTVSMGYTNHQYYPVDCGTVTIPKRWGAYMDYTPYTKLNIFLPYIGFRQISADDVMGKTLHLRYMIDILSGACNAELKVNNTVLYSWAGSCAMQIPITGNDWRSAITAGVSIAGSVAATVLSGGASAPMIAGTVASATVNSLALKPEVQRSGSLSSASGFLAAQRPYIVRTNPRNAIPANQNKYSGYPSFVTVSLGSLTGYNEVYSVHLENIPATGAELDEIETFLKGGAIF